MGLGTGAGHGALATDSRAGACPAALWSPCGWRAHQQGGWAWDRGQSSGPSRGRTQGRGKVRVPGARLSRGPRYTHPKWGQPTLAPLAPSTVPNSCLLEGLPGWGHQARGSFCSVVSTERRGCFPALTRAPRGTSAGPGCGCSRACSPPAYGLWEKSIQGWRGGQRPQACPRATLKKGGRLGEPRKPHTWCQEGVEGLCWRGWPGHQ